MGSLVRVTRVACHTMPAKVTFLPGRHRRVSSASLTRHAFLTLCFPLSYRDHSIFSGGLRLFARTPKQRPCIFSQSPY